MSMDFNNAPEQKEGGLIPNGTIAPVHLTVRPGNAGEGGWLKRSKDGGSMALDCEFTVIEGSFAKRKFWGLFTVSGTTEGHEKAGEISASRLRGILESARGIKPEDESETAKLARRVNSWGDFNGLRFLAKIGVKIGTGDFKGKDKNRLDFAVTPDRQSWRKVEQVAQPQGTFTPVGQAAQTVAAQAGASKKPSWAA